VGYVRSIPVEDENGDQLVVYEFQERRFLFWKVRRFELDTGEFVRLVDEARFVVAATGERLSRIP
jgi:hypothetical protein